MRKMITKEKMAIDPIPFDKQLLDHAFNLKKSVRDFLSPKDELVRLYNAIEKKLKSVIVNTGDAPRSEASDTGRWILRVMDTELGSLAQLPDAVKRRVESMYREVATAYLGWRRIQENQATEWLPPENMFEPSMLRELGHFYSDYQHTIKTLEMTRRTLNLLRSVDPLKDPETHGQLMKVLLEEKAGKNQLPHRILEQLTRADRNPAASYNHDP